MGNIPLQLPSCCGAEGQVAAGQEDAEEPLCLVTPSLQNAQPLVSSARTEAVQRAGRAARTHPGAQLHAGAPPGPRLRVTRSRRASCTHTAPPATSASPRKASGAETPAGTNPFPGSRRASRKGPWSMQLTSQDGASQEQHYGGITGLPRAPAQQLWHHFTFQAGICHVNTSLPYGGCKSRVNK